MGELIYVYVVSFVLCVACHFAANSVVGNRWYSMYSESHFLQCKNGIKKLIYFKPKHFDCYTLFEVLIFFMSYLFAISNTILFVLAVLDRTFVNSFYIVAGCSLVALLLLTLVHIVISDINVYREERYFDQQQISVYDYKAGVDRFLKRSKTESARIKAINFYRNYRKCRINHCSDRSYYLELDDMKIKIYVWRAPIKE